MYVVYVLSRDGSPLMPTRRFGRVRRLLNSGQAKAVSTKPFVIQLLYESGNYTQPLYGGTDPGRTNIGEAVVNQKGEVVYEAHVATRNKDIPKLMKNRKAHRQASRRGERLRRKRRAKKNGTTTEFPEGRKLPKYEKGVLPVKDITNTEAKFYHRKRPANWITPTARQCVQTHINMVKQICRILPVTHWTLEYNKFAFMLLEDGSVRGMDFQNGRMKGFPSVNAYIDYLQDGHCALCGSRIKHHHHIVPRHEGGSDTPENIVGLCNECHSKVHTNKTLLDNIGKKKKYAGASIINIAMPFIYNELLAMFGDNLHICRGFETAHFREEYNIAKGHNADAACIAAIGGNLPLQYDGSQSFEIMQFRNHDRANIQAQCERTYKVCVGTKKVRKGKKETEKPIFEVIAKNRKPRFEQDEKVPALSDWYSQLYEKVGCRQARIELSKVQAMKSFRRYNNTERILAGATFLFQKQRYTMTGSLTNNQYYRAYRQEQKNFPARDCIVVQRKSLAYV